jgi:hypothetical protein
VPTATAPKPERAFCSNCGFPVRGSRCDACGAAQDAAPARDTGDDVPTKQNQFRPYAPDLDVDTAGLERAIDAYRNKDTARFIEHLVVAEGAGTTRTSPTPEGSAWITTVRGSALFITLRPAADELTVEAPVARLPSRQRLPALRLALELCARDAATSRVCLRGDLLLLRFTARASMLTPAALRHYLRETGHLAARYAGLFVVGLDAVPAISDEQRGAGFEILGRARKVQLVGGSIRRSIPPPVERSIERSIERPPERPVIPTRQTGAMAAQRIPRQDEPTPEASAAEPIPAVLSPMFSSTPPSAPSAPAPIPAMPPPPAMPQIDDRRLRSNTAQTGSIPSDAQRRVADAPKPAAREIEVDAAPRRADTGPSAASGVQLSPSDRLCMLLRHAQSLASLTLEERPASMTWLVRSTVFRAIYDFKDSVPDAVAHLYRCTGIGKEPSSQSGSTPAAEPALHVMERVIVARGNMPKEKALALEPMVSASQAKEHVARYLSEIDKAPQDQGIRHFLALGALTELLVRTKLPPQTDQRLRDIVAHAQREGAKQSAIDLMMTALQRINS